jgi:hypothetical protein
MSYNYYYLKKDLKILKNCFLKKKKKNGVAMATPLAIWGGCWPPPLAMGVAGPPLSLQFPLLYSNPSIFALFTKFLCHNEESETQRAISITL